MVKQQITEWTIPTENILLVCVYYCMRRVGLYASVCTYRTQFINSLIQVISIAPLQVYYYSETLQITALTPYVGVNTPKGHMQLRVKDLPKVPTRRLERDSNPRPFGRRAPNLPMHHHAPQNDVDALDWKLTALRIRNSLIWNSLRFTPA